MIAAGFIASTGADGVRIRTYSEALLSIARHGPFTVVLLGRIYYRPPGNSDSDAALAAALYEQGGLAGLERLEGDFVVAAHDAHAQRIVAVRSAMGAYPLFWLHSRETFAIATSIRPLVESLEDVRIDDEYVADYLSYPLASMMELPSERTVYRGVQRLLPGWSLELDLTTRNVRRRRSWDWSARVESPRPATIEEAGAMIRERLQDAVRERLGRAGRTACHFSGGMDSTSVALLAEPLLAARGETLEALTHVYSRDPILASEREYIDCALEGRRALRHHALPSDDFLRWDAIESVPALDEPSTGVAFHRQSTALAELARDLGADTILGGDGADHLFAHPPSLLAAELLRGGRVVRALHVIREHAAATTGSTSMHLRELLRYFLPRRHSRVPPWFTRDYAEQQRLAERTAQRVIGFMRGRRFGVADLEELTGDWFNWNLGAPRGILITQPFFDTRVISLALGMPLRFHEPPRPMKPLLAAAMRGVLPEKIIHRSRKAHFGALVEGYSRNRASLERLVQQAPQEMFDRTALRAAIDNAVLGIYGDAISLGRLDLTISFLQWRRHHTVPY